jgi:hypothetical protein
VIVDFYKLEAFCFNVRSHLISLFAMNERKEILPFVAFLILTSQKFFLSYFMFVWWGLVRVVTGTAVRVS